MTSENTTPEPMKFNVTVKTFFGGFKPLLKEEFTDLSQAVDFATKNCDGKRHSMITTYQEGMRDMEFLFLYQKSSDEYTIRTNGKHIDNKPLKDVLGVVKGYLDTLLKPLPEIVVLTPEELKNHMAEKNSESHAKKNTDDRPKENN
jgi:hypothetical protein